MQLNSTFIKNKNNNTKRTEKLYYYKKNLLGNFEERFTSHFVYVHLYFFLDVLFLVFVVVGEKVSANDNKTTTIYDRKLHSKRLWLTGHWFGILFDGRHGI